MLTSVAELKEDIPGVKELVVELSSLSLDATSAECMNGMDFGRFFRTGVPVLWCNTVPVATVIGFVRRGDTGLAGGFCKIHQQNKIY